MKSEEIRKKFLEFFEGKDHKVVPSSSLVPENDSSVLFTTAGMQQFKPYYTGAKDAKKDFGTLNTTSVQKCVRTSDIDEVGDESHLTFFEMLGNFSFGGYWKKEAIQYAYEFITSPKWMNLKIDYVSIFAGEGNVPRDDESEKIWKSIDPNIKVKEGNRADNFWGPTGEEGPCGPTTEIYVDGIEIWNIVFNEYYQNKDGALVPLKTKGVDTGMGLERLVTVVNKVKSVYDTDLFMSVMTYVNHISLSSDTKAKRIISDHIRTATFMVSDGVSPSNTGRGYVLRRLIRRARYYLDSIGSNDKSLGAITSTLPEIYQNTNYQLHKKINAIDLSITAEETHFSATLLFGKKMIEKIIKKNGKISGEEMFLLYSTYGYPFELIKEIAKENSVQIDESDFLRRKKEHQEVSKAGMEKQFKGGLGGHSDMEIKYHTATHMLHQALHDVLGNEVGQKGSNITPERLRFDFSFPRKLTDEEKKKVEDIVNQKIKEALTAQNIILPKVEAEKTGARHFFDQKYPDQISIYFIGNSLESAWSKEYCGGPHVSNTSELGTFKITKEEAVSAGVRRIKAILE